jgi:hypothetical protein
MLRGSLTEEGEAMSLLSSSSGGAVGDIRVVLKEAENELNVVVEQTKEGFSRGRAQRLLERLKGVTCSS